MADLEPASPASDTTAAMIDCAVALIVADGRVLLGHRSLDRPTYPGVWDLFGGHVEAGETIEAALSRELDEELDIAPTAYEPLTVLAEPEGSVQSKIVSDSLNPKRSCSVSLIVETDSHSPTDRLGAIGLYGRKRYTIFKVTAWSGPGPRLTGDEHTEIAWFTPAEANDLDLADRAYKKLIADAVA